MALARRGFLKGVAGAAGLALVPPLVAACAGSKAKNQINVYNDASGPTHYIIEVPEVIERLKGRYSVHIFNQDYWEIEGNLNGRHFIGLIPTYQVGNSFAEMVGYAIARPEPDFVVMLGEVTFGNGTTISHVISNSAMGDIPSHNLVRATYQLNRVDPKSPFMAGRTYVMPQSIMPLEKLLEGCGNGKP
ncbi:hypothetical protein HYY72_05905 [Candidatus Woesearchaeota archaeon]|nr:hypothetical protein [Candidatus Woesearchaeota archaeon]